MLRYDHPLSERVRSLIRIEHLFGRFNHTLESDDKWSHHVAIAAMFEILESSSRADLKLEILQELERQRQYIGERSRAESLPDLEERINQAAHDLKDIQQKFGQHIRENEWLMALKQRLLVPGGTTPVELPSYNFWQKQPPEKRRADLRKWSKVMMPTYQATALLLEILRANQRIMTCHAQKGHYQANSLAQNIHLLSIELPIEKMALPEVSANKYFTHIRFLEANQENMRGNIVEQDIEFKMIMCSFDPTWLE